VVFTFSNLSLGKLLSIILVGDRFFGSSDLDGDSLRGEFGIDLFDSNDWIEFLWESILSFVWCRVLSFLRGLRLLTTFLNSLPSLIFF
jgi:hypothetical protein